MFRRLILALFVLTIVSVIYIHAQATRTWISGVGDDVNPCSRTAPCKTFAGAISKTADKGEINCLDPGGFGSVTITKSITLDCTGTQGSILGSGTNGIIINGIDAVVRIRNLNINGASTGTIGVRVVKAASVSIEGVVIDGFTTAVSVEGPGKTFITNTTLRNNRTGLFGASAANVFLSGSRIYSNYSGITHDKGATITSFKNNMIAGNDTNGIPNATADVQ